MTMLCVCCNFEQHTKRSYSLFRATSAATEYHELNHVHAIHRSLCLCFLASGQPVASIALNKPLPELLLNLYHISITLFLGGLKALRDGWTAEYEEKDWPGM
jgi:hypothetical protein